MSYNKLIVPFQDSLTKKMVCLWEMQIS